MKKIILTLILLASFAIVPSASAIVAGQELREFEAQQVNSLYAQVQALMATLAELQRIQLARLQAQQMNEFSQIGQLIESSNLSFGSRGEDVKQLQQMLNETTGSNLPITGYFGPMTQGVLGQIQTQLPSGSTASLGFGGTSSNDSQTAGTLTLPSSTPIDPNAPKFSAVVTAYCPFNTTNIKLEGGPKDERGAALQTLHQYVNQAKYPGGGVFVGAAVDLKLRSQGYPYGTRLRIPYFEQTYNNGRYIDFRVVDNGGAFNYRGKNPPDKVDVAVSDESMCTGFKKTLEIYKISAPPTPETTAPTSGFGN